MVAVQQWFFAQIAKNDNQVNMEQYNKSMGIVAVWITALLIAGGCGYNTVALRGDLPDYKESPQPYIAAGAYSGAGPETAPDLRHRVVLVGDAGAIRRVAPILERLGQWSDPLAERATVVYLGDNIYPDGLEGPDHAAGKEILDIQLSASTAQTILIPGNHDWAQGKALGWQYNKRQEDYVEAAGAVYAPEESCPGPVVKVLAEGGAGPAVVLVILDTQWWLQRRGWQPYYVMDEGWYDACGAVDEDVVIEELERVLERHRDDHVLVLGHHPLASSSRHGGYKKQRGKDLLYWLIGRQQDIGNPRYDHMIKRVNAAMKAHPPLVYAAGHDHNLQIMRAGVSAARYTLVSGAGSAYKITNVTHLPATIFAHGAPGFMVVDFAADGQIWLQVVESSLAEPVYAMPLRDE